MFTKKITLFGLAVATIALAGLTGCIKRRPERDVTLSHLSDRQPHFEQTQDDITLEARYLSAAECKRFLGKNPHKAHVIQLSVRNNGPMVWTLKKNGIDLPLLPTSTVATFFKFHRAFPITAITLLGFYHTIPGLLAMPFWAMGLPMALIVPLTGVCIAVITGTSLGIRALNRRAVRIDNETYETLARISPETLSIAPYDTTSMLLFVPRKKLQQPWDVVVRAVDAPAKMQTFTVECAC